YSRQAFEVSGKGFEFTFSDQIVDLMKVLKHCERDHHASWQEASAAAIALGIKSRREYLVRYKEDDKLPSQPSSVYPDFPSWGTFLSTGRRYKSGVYETWQEAGESVVRLGIKDRNEYRSRYKEDSRLPSNPYEAWDDFPGWAKFSGSTEKYYKTWQLASKVAQRLGITSSTAYPLKRKKDKLLPGKPAEVYKTFPGWEKFLGKTVPYKSIAEMSRAAIRLGIKGTKHYQRLRLKDPRLPCWPNRRSDFPGWDKFLGKK